MSWRLRSPRRLRRAPSSHRFRPGVLALEPRIALTVFTLVEDLLATAGVEADPSGNLYVSAIDNHILGQRSVVRAYNTSGAFLKSIELFHGGVVVGTAHLARLGTYASSIHPAYGANDLLALLPGGAIYRVDPNAGTASKIFELSELVGVDTSSVYDAFGNVNHNFGGTLLTGFASYGDIAVHTNTIVVTAASGGLPFVLRLKVSNGNIDSARILAASVAEETFSNQPRGVAINGQGVVLTTLPVGQPQSPSLGWDVPVSFGVNFPEGQGRTPWFPFGREATSQVSSRGIGVDPDGNFLIATGPVGSITNLNHQGIISIDAALLNMSSIAIGDDILLNARDVAVSPTTGLAYIAITDQGALWSSNYIAPPPAETVGGSFTGTVYRDTNDNGDKDPGEPGLAGWTVFVDENFNGALDLLEKRTVTDSQGRYGLDLQAGNYFVRAVVQGGYAITEPSLFAFRPAPIRPGVTWSDQDFGYRLLASSGRIMGFAYEDLNHNGRTDTTDVGMGGWTVLLNDANDNGRADPGEPFTVADEHGYYEFLNLSAGHYIVRPVVEPGWRYGPGNGPRRIDLDAGVRLDEANFIIERDSAKGSVSGTVYDDANGNGRRDPDDPGLAGWTVYLDANADSVRGPGERHTTTNADGLYRFAELDPGLYYIQRELPAGWRTTAPRLPTGQTEGVLKFADVTSYPINGLDFGQARVSATASIAGTVYRDDDASGGQNGGEPGLSGWTVFLDANGNNQHDEGETATTTDAQGRYRFEGLAPGRYMIQRDVPRRWRWTDPAIDGFGSGVALFAEVAGGAITDMNFGQFPPPPLGSIASVLYDDRNNNGRRDAGEPGLPDWTVFLDDDTDGVLDPGELSTQTDAEGRYSFPNLRNGRYYINRVVKGGWRSTEPAVGGVGEGIYWFADVGTAEITGLNFGQHMPILPGALEGSVYQDIDGDRTRDAGEPGLAGWTVYLDANQDSIQQPGERTTQTDAQGGFRFDNLAPGTYYINKQGRPGWHPTSPMLNGRTQGIYFFADVTNGLLGGLDFGVRRGEGGAVEGVAYRDLNGNRQRDAGEPAIPGWTVFLDANGNARLDPGERSTRTDADGKYRFDNLVPSRYQIAQVVPPGWSQTAPALPDGQTEGIYWFADVTGETVAGLDFGSVGETTPPTSSVAALPAIVRADRVVVRWSGNDGPAGSGVVAFDVYVSDNGGPFALWRGGTPATSDTFVGAFGHSYAFYSVAIDAVGNRQPTPGAPQAATVLDEPVQFRFDTASLILHEDGPGATVTIRRVGGLRGSASVRAATAGGTASAGVHFHPIDETLTFDDGVATRTVALRVLRDGVVAGDRSLSVVLSGPDGGATVSEPATVSVVIREADTLPPPLVTVREVRLVFDRRKNVTQVLIRFSGAVNPVQAGSLATYRLITAGKKGSFTVKTAKAIKLRSATYDPSSGVVTLRPKAMLGLTKAVQLQVLGQDALGLSDGLGRLIDGDRDGIAGGSAVALLGRKGVAIQSVPAPSGGSVGSRGEALHRLLRRRLR